MSRTSFCWLSIFFIVLLPVFSSASPQSEAWVNEGRHLLFKDGNPTYQGVLDANEKFKAAVDEDGSDQTAHLFYAVTRIAVFFLESDNQGNFETIADIVQAMGIPIYLDELIKNGAPFGKAPKLAGDYNPPDTLPNGDKLRYVLSPGLVGVIDQALADLDKIDSSINVVLTAQEIDDFSGVEVDYTDVLLAKAFLNALKTMVLIISAYDLDAMDIQEFIAFVNAGMLDLHPGMANQLLLKYPDFLRLANDGAALLSGAKTAFQTIFTHLSDAYESLDNESDSQDNDLFTYESEGDEQEFENMLGIFSEMIDSLIGNRAAVFSDTYEIWDATLNNGDTFSLDLTGDLCENGSILRDESDFQGIIDSQNIYGSIPYWKFTGDNVKIILTYWGYRRIVLTGSLVTDSSINGTYSFQEDFGSGYTQTESGTFSANRDSHGISDHDIDRFDLNNLFGNSGKTALDIRQDILPSEFDILGEPLLGKFKEPVLNGLLPDLVTRADLNEELELYTPYRLFTIPSAPQAMIEGDPSGWPAAFLVNTDPENDMDMDNPVPGMDILSTYLANDGTSLYMAMKLSGNPLMVYPGTNYPVYYHFEFRKNNYEWDRDSYQFGVHYNGTEWVVEISEKDSYGTYSHHTTLFENASADTNSFIKWKVPLSELNSLGTYGGTWINNSTWSEGIYDGDWIDSNTQLAPVFTIAGSVSSPAGFGTEDKIFIYLSDSESPPKEGDAIGGTYIDGAGSFTLNFAPYSAAQLFLHILWDTDGNGIRNSGDYAAMTSFAIQGDVNAGNMDPMIIPSLPLEAVSVKSVHSGDNQFRTFFDVIVGQDFSGNLPGDIDSITITYPDGTNHQIYPDGGAYWDDIYGEFFMETPGNPQLGEYIFTVMGKDGSTGVKSDTQKDLIPIPIVDVNSVKIGTYSKTPIVSWDPVSAPGTGIAYRLEVSDLTGDFSFRTGRDWNMTVCTLPELQAGRQYQYRIRAVDDTDWIQVDNRSHTKWVTFTMDTPLSHAAVPAVDLDGWGAVEYRNANGFSGIDIWIKLIDHDGVAYNGSSHDVKAIFLDGNENELGQAPLDFDHAQKGITGFYTTWINSDTVNAFSAFPAAVKFHVTDPDGTIGVTTDVLTEWTLSPPGDIALTCSVEGTTPTFTWNPVTNANHYRLRIYDVNFNTVWRGYPGNVDSYTVPSGILAPNTTYRYKLDARDAHSGFDTDHNFTTPVNREDYPAFTTGSRVDAPFIDAGSSGVKTWSDEYRGTLPTFWIKVHDAQGVPDNIQTVKAIHPDGITQTELYYEYNESANCAIYSNDAYESQTLQSRDYTFVAVDKDGHQFSLTEALTVNPIGYPAESSFSVVVDGTGAEFDWEDVTGAAFYRLEIYNKHHERILEFETTDSQYTLAPGFLKAGELYGFRVSTRREFWDQNTDNGSTSPWSFYEATNFKTQPVVHGSHLPEIDTDNFGVAVIYLENPLTGGPSYWLQFSVVVTDADTVPGNIKSVIVQGSGITGSLDLHFDWQRDDTSAEYWNRIAYTSYDDIPEGIYTFTVEDEDGNIATTTDTLVKTQIPLVPYLTPTNGAILKSDSPVIDWVEPEGGPYFYKVRIYKHWHTRIHQSGILNASRYRVPSAILKPGEVYGYRIYAYDNDPGTADVDNVSINQLFFAKQNHFMVSDEPLEWTLTDIFRLINLLIGKTSDIPSLEGDLNGDGQLNIKDAMPMLQEAGGLR